MIIVIKLSGHNRACSTYFFRMLQQLKGEFQITAVVRQFAYILFIIALENIEESNLFSKIKSKFTF